MQGQGGRRLLCQAGASSAQGAAAAQARAQHAHLHSAGCCTPLRAASSEARGWRSPSSWRGARLMRRGSTDTPAPLPPPPLLTACGEADARRRSSCSSAGSSCCQLSAAESTGVSHSRRLALLPLLPLLGLAGLAPPSPASSAPACSVLPPLLLLSSEQASASSACTAAGPSSSRGQSTATSRLTPASAYRWRSSAAASQPGATARLAGAAALATKAVTWVAPAGKRRLTSCAEGPVQQQSRKRAAGAPCGSL